MEFDVCSGAVGFSQVNSVGVKKSAGVSKNHHFQQ